MRRAVVGGVVLGAVVVGVVAWSLISAATYSGLDNGTTSFVGNDAAMVTSSTDPTAPQVAQKSLREHQITQFGVSVYNAGSRTVMVTGVGDELSGVADRGQYALTPAGVSMSRSEYATDQLEPFTPVKLEPGHERVFMVSEPMPP